MRFQPRDGDLLKRIYYFGDGLLARRHIRRLFWPDAVDDRAMERRLKKLREAAYITWPTRRQYRNESIPEPVVFLDWRGVLWVANEYGVEVESPKNQREKQLRILAKSLRDKGIHWRRIGGFSKLSHDIKVIDVKLAIVRSADELPVFTFLNTIPESVLRSYADEVEFYFAGADGKVWEGRQGVIPDSFLILANEERKARNETHLLLLPLEVDMRTRTVVSHKSHPDFGHQKAAPYAAYIGSPQYEARFGYRAGRWLIVTTGKRRMENLMRQTEVVVGEFSELFFFSYFDMLGLAGYGKESEAEEERVNVLSHPVWWRVGESDPGSLDAVL